MPDVVHAVIPAAGLGTRMLPAAKAVPKEMLPIVDRPTIQCVVEEAAGAGARDVLLVTSREKRAIEDHFDRSPELERRLESAGRAALLRSVSELAARVRVHATRQAEQLGLGHAVAHAEQHVGDRPFLCLLGDAVFRGDPSPSRQLIDAHRRLGGSVIGVELVPVEKVGRYGIVGGDDLGGGLLRVRSLIEKPSPEQAPSRFAIAARYLLTPGVFACIAETRPGAGGEIQLTDALRLLLEREPVHALRLEATRHDIGNPTDWLLTNLAFARRDAALWQRIVDAVNAEPGATGG